MAVNMIVASGRVKAPAFRYATDGKAEYRFTLVHEEGDFCLWLPCFAPGAAAERLHEQLDEGMTILITSGKLAYKKRSTKSGEVSRLEILTWAVDVLTDIDATAQAEAPERTSGWEESALPLEAARIPEPGPGPKARKRAVPKHQQREWHPASQQ